jgi:hypothetical protein
MAKDPDKACRHCNGTGIEMLFNVTRACRCTYDGYKEQAPDTSDTRGDRDKEIDFFFGHGASNNVKPKSTEREEQIEFFFDEDEWDDQWGSGAD